MGIKILAFFVTEKCNLSCEYCDIPTIRHPRRHYDIPSFLKYINIINDFPLDCVTLTGGEPGLLPHVHLDTLFSKIEHPINVNTNGEFLRRGFYEKYKNKIQLLDYHVTDLVEYDLDEKGRYIIVSHRLNQEWIELTEMNYPDIPFTIWDYDDKLNEEKFRTGFENPYKDCYNPIKEIDWVNKKLVDCCSSPISSPKDDLTHKNLDMFLITNYARPWHGCKTCQRQVQRYGK